MRKTVIQVRRRAGVKEKKEKRGINERVRVERSYYSVINVKP